MFNKSHNPNMKRSRNNTDNIVKRSKSELIDIKSGNLTIVRTLTDTRDESEGIDTCIKDPIIALLLYMGYPSQQDVPICLRPILEKYTSGYYCRRHRKSRFVIEKRLPALPSTAKSLVSAYLVKDIFDWMCCEFRVLKRKNNFPPHKKC